MENVIDVEFVVIPPTLELPAPKKTYKTESEPLLCFVACLFLLGISWLDAFII